MQVKGESQRQNTRRSMLMEEKMRDALHVTGFRESPGIDDKLSYHNNTKFSTYDAHSDSCSLRHHGAWWYNKCHSVNLNAPNDEFQKHG